MTGKLTPSEQLDKHVEEFFRQHDGGASKNSLTVIRALAGTSKIGHLTVDLNVSVSKDTIHGPDAMITTTRHANGEKSDRTLIFISWAGEWALKGETANRPLDDTHVGMLADALTNFTPKG